MEQYLAAAAAVAAIVLVYRRIVGVNPTTVALTLLLGVLVVSAAWGLRCAVFMAVVSTLAFNYYFLPPVGTFTIADPQNWIALFAFLATALLASQLSEQAKRRTSEALSRQREIERVHALSRAILLMPSDQPIASHLAREIARIYELQSVAIYDSKTRQTHFAGAERMAEIEPRLLETAVNGTLIREGEITVTAFSLGGQPIGSLAVRGAEISDGALQSLCNLVAIAIEKERNQEAATRANAARQSEEFKSTLLDALAHEFKTPLTSIKAATSALLASDIAPPEQQRDFTVLIDEEADRLNNLVNEALHLSRIEAGRVRLNRRLIHLPDVLQEALKQFEPMLEGRTLEVTEEPGLPPATADAELIRLAIHQLIDNALKYSQPRSPIQISLGRSGSAAKVRIWNRGYIPQAEQSRVFEKFYRGANGKQQAGTGMGLAIAREILLAHGGDVHLQSDAKEGTEFTVILPLMVKEVLR